MVNLSYRINNYTRRTRANGVNGGGDMDMGGDDL
jgi:hypothetical protein